MSNRKERGAISVEFVVLLPAALLILGAVIAAGRVWLAQTAVQQFADSAARQASISRTAGEAQSSARALVSQDVANSDLACSGGAQVELDLSGFSVPVGQPAEVRATVTCLVPLDHLIAPGMAGSVTTTGSSTSTLDRFRARS